MVFLTLSRIGLSGFIYLYGGRTDAMTLTASSERGRGVHDCGADLDGIIPRHFLQFMKAEIFNSSLAAERGCIAAHSGTPVGQCSSMALSSQGNKYDVHSRFPLN